MWYNYCKNAYTFAIIVPPIVSVREPECTVNFHKLGSVSWRTGRWLKRVETCRPKIVFYIINCCVGTDILYYVCTIFSASSPHLWKDPPICVVAGSIFVKMLFVPKLSTCSLQQCVDNGLTQHGDGVPRHCTPSKWSSMLRAAVILQTGMAVNCSELKFQAVHYTDYVISHQYGS